MRTLVYEFMLSLRRLFRRRVQTGLMLATFTVSITLSLVSWSLFYTMFLKQPDYDPAGGMVIVGLRGENTGDRLSQITRLDLAAWQARQTVFAELAGFSIYRSTFIATKTSSQRHLGALLSTDIQRMVGAKPMLGRLFTEQEDKFKCAPVIILSEHLWRSRFDSDPKIIGQLVRVDGYDTSIVGVLPDTFHFPNNQDVWLPLGFDIWAKDNNLDDDTIEGLGRLKPGVSLEQATKELQAILESRGSGTIAAKYHMHVALKPIRNYFLFAYMQQSALVLLVLSIVFVLVSCANVANLVMIDFFGRTAELGAGTELIFVEGHSRDDTWAQIQRVAQEYPDRKIKIMQQTGKGKGDAVRLGFAAATGDILMILDADLTMPPEELPKFYEVIANGRAEFANGVRLVYPMDEEAMQFLNLCANKAFGIIFTWLLGQPVKDTLCGTKVLSRHHYERIAANRAYFGDFDPFGDFDLLFGAAKLNLKIADVPIRYKQRTYGTTNIHRWSHGWLLLRMVVFAARKLKFV